MTSASDNENGKFITVPITEQVVVLKFDQLEFEIKKQSQLSVILRIVELAAIRWLHYQVGLLHPYWALKHSCFD